MGAGSNGDECSRRLYAELVVLRHPSVSAEPCEAALDVLRGFATTLPRTTGPTAPMRQAPACSAAHRPVTAAASSVGAIMNGGRDPSCPAAVADTVMDDEIDPCPLHSLSRDLGCGVVCFRRQRHGRRLDAVPAPTLQSRPPRDHPAATVADFLTAVPSRLAVDFIPPLRLPLPRRPSTTAVRPPCCRGGGALHVA